MTTIIIDPQDSPEDASAGTHFYTITGGRAIPLSPLAIWNKWHEALDALAGVLRAHGRMGEVDCPCPECQWARAVLAGNASPVLPPLIPDVDERLPGGDNDAD